ncbi:unnamed protein product [Urochloa humidicola]
MALGGEARGFTRPVSVLYACFDLKFTILGKHHNIPCIIVLAIPVCSLFNYYHLYTRQSWILLNSGMLLI